jgi:colanic acid/amylovoran biosynthesis protein
VIGKIVVEPSDYYLRNIGDSAMLSVALMRLAQLFPEAEISVFNDDPEGLAAIAPQRVQALNIYGRRTWLDDGFMPGAVERLAPAASAAWLRRRAPRLVGPFWRWKLRGARHDRRALGGFLRTIRNADALVVTGMGGITDAFPQYARGVLHTLSLALANGVPRVVMMGQGFGPLHDLELRGLAQQVLPRLDLIALREKRESAPLLQALGVAPERVAVTGDDALELVATASADTGGLGAGLGVNLRLAEYSGVRRDMTHGLSDALAAAMRRHGAYAAPVPISRTAGEEDLEAIVGLVPVRPDLLRQAACACTPADVLSLVALCRVVVTGSYHAAVFALGSGRPAIGLIGSDYYAHKFLGLADMFGEGCECLRIDDPQLGAKLTDRLDHLWAAAERLGPSLRARAMSQIEANRAAYARLRH